MLKVKYKVYYIIKSFIYICLYRDIKNLFLYLALNFLSLNYKINIIYLPQSIKKFSVVRSPTMSKLSKEQFEIRVNRVCLIFYFVKKLDLHIFFNLLYKLKLNYSFFKYQLVLNYKKYD